MVPKVKLGQPVLQDLQDQQDQQVLQVQLVHLELLVTKTVQSALMMTMVI
jgi:hypothetical protein